MPAPVVRLILRPLAALAAHRDRRRLEHLAARLTPLEELRTELRKRALNRSGAPTVAGPWLGDELGELLYWIPFLRWAQTASAGLGRRLFVICRASSASWYGGVGAARVELEQLTASGQPVGHTGELGEDVLQGPLREQVARAFGLGSRAFTVLPPGPVAAARAELAGQSPSARIERRWLEFAPLVPPGLPAGLELPAEFVAVGGAPSGGGSVVGLGGLDRAGQAAVLARSRGFVGAFGAEALVALLVGVPAVVFAAGADEDDVRLVRSFLAGPPYGRLQVVEGEGSPAEVAVEVGRLLAAPVEALAGV